MSGFAEKLSALCSDEMRRALKSEDQNAIGEMVERLTHSLAFTIAFGCKGDHDIIGTLLAGVEAYLSESTSSSARVAKMTEKEPTK